jgi:hypothetical protein
MRWSRLTGFELPSTRPPNLRRTILYAGAGTTIGMLAAGVGVWFALSTSVAGARASSAAAGSQASTIEATNLPPLLTLDGDHLDALRYDINCTSPSSETDSGCVVDGTVYVKPSQSSGYRAIPLQFDHAAEQNRYVAALPAEMRKASGFSYYAVIRDLTSGATVTLPAGGAQAPQRSARIVDPIEISLGTHAFGNTRRADARVATAAWGDGATDVGIEDGPQQQPIGASSFDVDLSGAVTVLDEAHKRLLRFRKDNPKNTTAIPVDIRGTIADIATKLDGGVAVLESVAEPGSTPVLRAFDSSGHAVGSWHAAQPAASALRSDPAGQPQALEYPAGQWMPVSGATEAAASQGQLRGGHPGRAVSGGREIVAEREGNEARVAITNPAGVLRSWRITSATPLGEIQLAELRGNDVVLVLRTYTDAAAEFTVLVLGTRGLVQQFAVDAADWAETAPLAHFRLVGSSLYRLGSTRAGMFVDRFDLEVH